MGRKKRPQKTRMGRGMQPYQGLKKAYSHHGEVIDIEKIKQIEKEIYERGRTDEPLPPVTVEEIRKTLLQPCYTTGTHMYSDIKMALHNHILQDGGWENKQVLDYGCGNGHWSIYFALTGARKVVGFDLSEIGVKRGWQRVKLQGLEDKVSLVAMDATNLGFHDNTFDIVIGTAILHHVIKYPGIFEELYRVMKPGAKAYFQENLADFPLFKLWWKLKGPVPWGDVPIFAKDFKRRAHMFSDIEILGDSFLFSLKRFLWEPEMGRKKKAILRLCNRIDNKLFNIFPQLRLWGSDANFILIKGDSE